MTDQIDNQQQHARDAVALQMAPALTHHLLQRVETFLSTAGNDSNPVQAEFVRQLDAARQTANISMSRQLFNQSDDIWAQDFLGARLRQHAESAGPRGHPRDAAAGAVDADGGPTGV